MRRFLIIGSALLGGCFFGTFQTPETARPGQGTGAVFANFPGFLHPDHSEVARDNNIYRTWGFGGYVGGGLMDGLEGGIVGYAAGLGPYLKIRAWRSKKRRSGLRVASLSVMPSLVYGLFTGGYFYPGVSLIYGYRPSKYWMWYLYWQGVYFAGWTADTMPQLWGTVNKGFLKDLHNYFAVGIDWSTKAPGDWLGMKKTKLLYGARVELGGSWFTDTLTGKHYPLITLGIALTGGSALYCLKVGGSCASAAAATGGGIEF